MWDNQRAKYLTWSGVMCDSTTHDSNDNVGGLKTMLHLFGDDKVDEEYLRAHCEVHTFEKIVTTTTLERRL